MEHHTHDTGGSLSLINNLGIIVLNAMAWIFTANGLQTIGSLFLTFLSLLFVGFQFFMKIVEYKDGREAKRIAKELENKPKISDHE